MNWAWYLIQVNIYIAIFYAFYSLFLSRETWFTLNRIYLISAAAASFLIPFIKPEWIIPSTADAGFRISIGELEMMVTEAAITARPSFNWGALISTVYVCGMIYLAALFIWRLVHVRVLLSANHRGMAFSFFGRKIIDSKLPGQEAIHRHEDVHIRQWHTIDVVYFELLSIVLWCNPLIYFYKHSIKNIHEYLADESAAALEGDKEAYSMLLLSKAFHVDQNVLTNSFFTTSLIKKRILMLNKQRSTKTAILKYGLFLPLFAGMLLLSSAKISSNEEIKDLAEQIPDPVPTLFNGVSETGAGEMFSAKPVAQDTTKKKRQSKSAGAVFITSKKTATNDVLESPSDFLSIDTQPGFPGGLDKFYQYLGKAIKYPKEALEQKKEGKVFLSFIVEKDGKINDVKVVKSLGAGTDEEAVRVLSASPKWIPGTVDDKPVRVKYHVPVTFALSKKSTDSLKTGKMIVVTADHTQQNGKEGTSTKIGLNGPGKPMVLLDGEKITAEEMKKIDPNTIESIQVIKDKNILAAYGEEGKDGVIRITSKKAK